MYEFFAGNGRIKSQNDSVFFVVSNVDFGPTVSDV